MLKLVHGYSHGLPGQETRVVGEVLILIPDSLVHIFPASAAIEKAEPIKKKYGRPLMF